MKDNKSELGLIFEDEEGISPASNDSGGACGATSGGCAGCASSACCCSGN